MTSLNSHRLLRLIEQTVPHSDSEDLPQIHGIRLDSDGVMLHAVATDRFTLAVARAQLREPAAPFALTVARPDVEWLTAWLNTLRGDEILTLSPGTDGITITTDATKLVLPARGDEYVPWRDLARTALANPLSESPFTGLQPHLLARWEPVGRPVRVWQSTPEKAMVIIGEDFLGFQMPTRFRDQPSRPEAVAAWNASLGDGNTKTDMAPVPTGPRRTAEFDEQLLRQTLRSISEAHDLSMEAQLELWTAWIHAGIYAWSAHRLLDALRTIDPDRAETTVRDLEEQLEHGEIGEWAWDDATAGGHDPEQWQAELQEHKERQAAKRTKAKAAEKAAR
ncbi:hypothetical protein [Streptomyces lydicamycinicus]|uniref:hypothetical protein n=1 Tax=Streptomyces lydicamycinicus TaxID=1546107 RepID=UPI003C2FDCBF